MSDNFQNWYSQFAQNQNQSQMNYAGQPYNPDVNGGGGFQQPANNNQWGQNFAGQLNGNQAGATNMPTYTPDYFGNSNQGFTGNTNFRPIQPLNYGQPQPANQGQGGFGSTDYMNRGGGGYFGNGGLQQVNSNPYPVGGGGMQQSMGGGTNPDAGYPKFDPGFLSQVQGALEDPNGPYANRQPGDYAPPDAPENIKNPQTQADWQARFYYFASHPEALTNPSAPGSGLSSQLAALPWQQFAKDVYADRNANRSFNELSGVVDDARLQQAQQQFGWQLGPSGLQSNDAAVAQATQMKQAHPEYSYQVYQRPDGTFGIAARELDQKSQQDRGFYAPGMAPKPAATPHPVSNTYRGGGGGSSKPVYTATQIAQQQALGKYGAGALSFAVQHIPTPAAPPPNGSRGRTNSLR